MPTWLKGLIAWLRSLVPPAPPTIPQEPLDDSTIALRAAMQDAINEIRIDHGRPIYHSNYALNDAAQAWSQRMARAGVLDHGDFASRMVQAGFPAAGEDIVEADTAERALALWMASQPHRETILDDSYRLFGVGCARDVEGRLWWTLDCAA